MSSFIQRNAGLAAGDKDPEVVALTRVAGPASDRCEVVTGSSVP
jgi:hypothetical protein